MSKHHEKVFSDDFLQPERYGPEVTDSIFRSWYMGGIIKERNNPIMVILNNRRFCPPFEPVQVQSCNSSLTCSLYPENHTTL